MEESKVKEAQWRSIKYVIVLQHVETALACTHSFRGAFVDWKLAFTNLQPSCCHLRYSWVGGVGPLRSWWLVRLPAAKVNPRHKYKCCVLTLAFRLAFRLPLSRPL